MSCACACLLSKDHSRHPSHACAVVEKRLLSRLRALLYLFTVNSCRGFGCESRLMNGRIAPSLPNAILIASFV